MHGRTNPKFIVIYISELTAESYKHIPVTYVKMHCMN